MPRDVRKIFLLFCSFFSCIACSAAQGERSGLLDVTFFSSPVLLPFRPPGSCLFGGYLRVIQTMNPEKILLGFGIALFLACGVLSEKRKQIWSVCSLATVFILSSWLSLRLSEGLDEMFIGVKHAYSIYAGNKYSYNLSNFQEGSGDFLPILVTGILGKLGFPLPETFILLGLIGNLAIIGVVFAFGRSSGLSKRLSFLLSLLMGCFPCVLYTACTGFFSPLFSGALLVCVYLLFFSLQKEISRPTLVLISSLTLFRLEGIFFAFLLWIIRFVIVPVKSESVKPLKDRLVYGIQQGAWIAVPFFVATALRRIYFGHPFPAPVGLKSAFGDEAFLRAGFQYFLTTVQNFKLAWIWLGIGIILLIQWKKSPYAKWHATTLCVFLLFSVPYIIGGGDWFSSFWARYLMPLILFSYLSFFLQWLAIIKRPAVRVLFFVAIVILCFARWAGIKTQNPILVNAGLSRKAPNAFMAAAADVLGRGFSWTWIDSLGYFGKFLDLTLSPQALVATPEEGTLLYYSFRDAQDLVGFSDPDIAYSPFHPMSPGNIMHRKRNPEVIKKHLPDVIAFWEMSLLRSNKSGNSLDQYEKDFQELGLDQSRIDVAFYRAGSPRYLQRLGYRHLVVSTPVSTFSYLVSKRTYAKHVEALKKFSFEEIGSRKYPYQISRELFDEFSSGEELLGRI